jgi:hypothetical protein
MELLTLEQIDSELQCLDRGEAKSWIAHSILLDSIEGTGYWQRDSGSFTDWVVKNAHRFGVKPPMVWRRLSAGRSARRLRDRLSKHGESVPGLEDIARNIGPESLEILAKLERSLPAERFDELADSALRGKTKRSELRSMWETYRPILGGRTARGRGVTPPKVNTKDHIVVESLMRAKALDTLKSSESDWTGHKGPEIFKVFLYVAPDCNTEVPDNYIFSAVVAVKPKKGYIETHGIRFRHYKNTRGLKNDYSTNSYCDYIWYVMSYETEKSITFNESEYNNVIPWYAGLLLILGGKVNIIKQAQRTPDDHKMRNMLLSALLARSLEKK